MYSFSNNKTQRKERAASVQWAFDFNRDETIFIVIAVNKKYLINLVAFF